MGFMPAKAESVVVLLCRVCVEGAPGLKDMGWDLSEWMTLVQDRRFLGWLVKEPTEQQKFVGRTSRGHTGGRSHRISHPPFFCVSGEEHFVCTNRQARGAVELGARGCPRRPGEAGRRRRGTGACVRRVQIVCLPKAMHAVLPRPHPLMNSVY
ncbi:unnamed protein product [Ascophyllum nodosum]